MAYYVKYGDTYLHNLLLENYILTDLELDCEENSCGYLDFSIYPNHPMYGKLKDHDYKNLVTVYENDTVLFSGYIYEQTQRFDFECQVRCKGELDFLNQSIVRPHASFTRGFGTKVSNTYSGYFKWLIKQHNDQVDAERAFSIGINEGNILSNGTKLDYYDDEYPSTIEAISNVFIGDEGIGGYLRVRHENGVRYVDLLSEWNDINTQILDFGVNLTDYTKSDKCEELVSFIVPTGAQRRSCNYSYVDGYFETSDSVYKKDKTYYTRKMKYVEYQYYELTEYDFENQYHYVICTRTEDGEGNYIYTITDHTYPHNGVTYYLWYGQYTYSEANITAFDSGVSYYEYDEYDDQGNTLLTIDWDDLPDGPIGVEDFCKNGDCIYSPSNYLKIGRVGVHVSNSNIQDYYDLFDAAITTFKELSQPKYTIEIKAVDMHFINPDIKPIAIGEYVRVRSRPHNLDSYFICRNITLDLNDPSQSTYVLGMNYDTLTQQQQNKIQNLNATINQQMETVTKLTEAEKARSNDDFRRMIAISQEQDAAITSLFEMIIGS